MPQTLGRTVSEVAEHGIRFGLFAVFVVGLRRRDPSAVVNAVVALVGTYLPGGIERRYDVDIRSWQRVYAESAMLTHAVGMLGPYDEIWWWDHVTHTHSATLLGGLVHAVARRRGRDPRPRVLAAVACLGVTWEILEYAVHAVGARVGFEPILVNYGKRDTVLDLGFNFVGACLVLIFGDRLLANVANPEQPAEP